MKSASRILGSVLCLGMGFGLTACSKTDNDPKNSSDFTTDAIDAFYYFEIDEDNKVGFRATFENDDRALELDGGDRVEVVGGNDTHSFTVVKSGSSVTYVANVDEGSAAPSNYQFKFVRDTLETSDDSYINVPKPFDITSPSSDSSLTPDGGTSFDITWDFVDDSNSSISIQFDYNCSRADGSSPISGSKTIPDVPAESPYEVKLADILNSTTSQTCNDFDITAYRTRTGSLDLVKLNGGSLRGAQVRQVLNLFIDGIDLN